MLVIGGLIAGVVLVALLSRTMLWWLPAAACAVGAVAFLEQVSPPCHGDALCAFDNVANSIEIACAIGLFVIGLTVFFIGLAGRREVLARRAKKAVVPPARVIE
jgi:hypothetical protein